MPKCTAVLKEIAFRIRKFVVTQLLTDANLVSLRYILGWGHDFLCWLNVFQNNNLEIEKFFRNNFFLEFSRDGYTRKSWRDEIHPQNRWRGEIANISKNFLSGAFGAAKTPCRQIAPKWLGGAKPNFALPPQSGVCEGAKVPLVLPSCLSQDLSCFRAKMANLNRILLSLQFRARLINNRLPPCSEFIAL